MFQVRQARGDIARRSPSKGLASAFCACDAQFWAVCAFHTWGQKLQQCVAQRCDASTHSTVYHDIDGKRRLSPRAKLVAIGAGVLVLIFTGITLGVVLGGRKTKTIQPGALGALMNYDNMLNSLEQLEAIAKNTTTGSRAFGTAGYDESVEYIKRVLSQYPNLKIEEQTFTAPFSSYIGVPSFVQANPVRIQFHYGIDFLPVNPNIGNASLIAEIVNVNSGCNAADYTAFVAGRIAIAITGGCTTQARVDQALAANASGLLIYNDGTHPTRNAPCVSA